MVKDLIKTFVETLVISVGIILLMKFIGYVPQIHVFLIWWIRLHLRIFLTIAFMMIG
ncbi:hypothetical protein [Staphylococcus felis]|uniref:hypothetical protein n=1 Tax=Staphylococcus felis TaxID=46127 RepID=UPI001EE8E331|nr:hypothetical protein [Staphylococcus felis]